ncbi:MAG TPA: hypothetical protein VFX61_05620 [Micromonosporaceae bacterium]|nr:hypothetical protein [Micromonosporaceae bacterium]
MDDLVGAPPDGGTGWTRLRRLVPLLALVLAITGCGSSSGGSTDAPAEPRPVLADLAELRTPNGLLYPPELWSALAVSPRSEVLRNLALSALGEDIVWSRPPAGLHAALVDETDGLTAASLMLEAGLDPAVKLPLVTKWLAEAERAGKGYEALQRRWQAVTFARHTGVDVELSRATLDEVREMITDPSPLAQRQAADILTAAGAPPAPEDIPEPQAWLRRLATTGAPDAQTLARELHSWVILHRGAPGLSRDRTFWKPLLEAAPVSDEANSYAVRAFAAAGNPDLAHEIAARFDKRRLVTAGVLEPPVFSGSLGSTFRMIRFLHEGPSGVAPLDGGWTSSVIGAVEPLMTRDLSHRLAGLATLHLLRPGTVPLEQRRAVIAEALSDVGAAAGTPMSAEVAMGWISVAEHAIVFGVPVEFPGLSPAALEALRGPEDDALYAVARLLLALHGAGHQGAEVVRGLAEHLRSALTGREIAEVNTLLLFGGSLALLKVVGKAPFTASQLRDENDRRWGQCRGGFQSFIREGREPNSVCNVEATRYANALQEVTG